MALVPRIVVVPYDQCHVIARIPNERDLPVRWRSGRGSACSPTGWSPDGRSIYASIGNKMLSIPVGPAGRGGPHTVFTAPQDIGAASVSADGKKFVYSAEETIGCVDSRQLRSSLPKIASMTPSGTVWQLGDTNCAWTPNRRDVVYHEHHAPIGRFPKIWRSRRPPRMGQSANGCRRNHKRRHSGTPIHTQADWSRRTFMGPAPAPGMGWCVTGGIACGRARATSCKRISFHPRLGHG
jgi:hypothetical protein